MGSTELNERGTHERDSPEISDDTPMYNPQGLPLIKGNISLLKV